MPIVGSGDAQHACDSAVACRKEHGAQPPDHDAADLSWWVSITR